jgi:GGDEF domain-containing protein
MRVSDRFDPKTLRSREIRLLVLAVGLNIIISIGLAIFAYPSVLVHPGTLGRDTARIAYIVFCGLSIISVGFVVIRQIVLNQVREKLLAAELRLEVIRDQASSDVIKSFPTMNNFRVRMDTEFRRCLDTGEPLSVLLILVSLNKGVTDSEEIASAYGEAAKAILVRTRNGESVFAFEPGAFGTVLAGCSTLNATRITDRFVHSLEQAAGKAGKFTFETRILNHPEHAAIPMEMEEAVRLYLADGQLALARRKVTSTPVHAA